MPLLLLQACGEGPANPPLPDQIDVESRAAFLKQQEQDRIKFAKINYPACEDLWSGDKLSKCGDLVLQRSLTECQKVAGEKLGSSAAIIDQWTGDSWQARAGFQAKPLEERGKYLSRSDTYMEQFAYAKGDGTDELGHITCSLDARIRLDGVDVI